MAEDPIRCYGLIGNLPKTSRIVEEELGGPHLSFGEYMLALIEFWQHSWVYAHGEDAKRKVNPPELQLPEYIKLAQATQEEKELAAVTPESIREFIYGAEFK